MLFIDAREKSDYNLKHIKGAINFPFDSFDEYQHLLKDISKDKTIVTYFAGTDCDLSILLGNRLFSMGYKKNFIFFGGWNDWQPSDDVIVPPAGSCGTAKDRMEGKEDMKLYDSFFYTKKLHKETVLKTVLKK